MEQGNTSNRWPPITTTPGGAPTASRPTSARPIRTDSQRMISTPVPRVSAPATRQTNGCLTSTPSTVLAQNPSDQPQLWQYRSVRPNPAIASRTACPKPSSSPRSTRSCGTRRQQRLHFYWGETGGGVQSSGRSWRQRLHSRLLHLTGRSAAKPNYFNTCNPCMLQGSLRRRHPGRFGRRIRAAGRYRHLRRDLGQCLHPQRRQLRSALTGEQVPCG